MACCDYIDESAVSLKPLHSFFLRYRSCYSYNRIANVRHRWIITQIHDTTTNMAGTQWENTQIQPRDLPADFLQKPITHGLFANVSKPTKREVQGDEVNHWRLFFAIGADESISLDMVKQSPDDLEGTVGVLGRTYAVSNIGVLSIPMIPATGLTMATVLDLLESNGMLRYRYAPTGEGCRYWIWSVVRLLKQNGLLIDADKQFPQFDDCIGCLWGPGLGVNSAPVGTPKRTPECLQGEKIQEISSQ